MLRNLLDSVITILIVAFTTAFSMFIYINIFETIFMVDLEHSRAVQTTDLPTIFSQASNNEGSLKEIGFFGKPSIIRYPRLEFATNIQESKKTDNGWLLARSTVGYHTFGVSNAGVIGDTTLFALENSKVLDFIALSNEGDRIVVETDLGWRYNYKIVSRQVVPSGGKYLPSDSATGRIYLVDYVNDKNSLIIECEFSSVEEA